eukprot:g19114.t1
MTNAHVVANAIDIRVRPHGSARRFAAKVQTYGPDVDLALVKIEESVEQDFWAAVADAPPVELAEALPALQETVRALGFPTGGRTLCITEGVVSRVDSIELTPPADTTLVIQIDAAINPGNSGGPVFDSRGYITGVAFCKDRGSDVRNCTDNIGYVIPAAVVRTFLDRCGKERDGYTLSPSENQSLRAAHKVPHEISGVLLTSVAPFLEGSLKVSDVLMKIDGRTISDDGQIELRGHELIQHRYLLRNKGIGDKTTFVVFREGQKVECPPVELKDLPPICPRWPDVDYLPEYVILGALALVPLAQGHHWYKEPSGVPLSEREQLVLLVTVFAHELTFGYNRGWRVVESYNGTRITSLRHVRDLWRETHLGREALVPLVRSVSAFPHHVWSVSHLVMASNGFLSMSNSSSGFSVESMASQSLATDVAAANACFFMILATELGDETFIIAAVMSMRHPKFVVLSGALGALYFMTVLSAFLGVVLPNLISQERVTQCATILYTFFGLRLMYVGARGEEDKDEEFEEVENTLKDSASKGPWHMLNKGLKRVRELGGDPKKEIWLIDVGTPVFLEALMLTFLAEWGDRSQIATISLAAHQNPLAVILGAIVVRPWGPSTVTKRHQAT